MNHAKHLILGLAASLLAAAPVGVATTGEPQHAVAHHMGPNADTLPAAVRQATARYLARPLVPVARICTVAVEVAGLR